MIKQFLVDLAKLVLGVTIVTYVGARIMRYELQKQIPHYIKNEIPHLLKGPELKAKAQELARIFLHEVYNLIIEELGAKRERR
ncbi:MAG: hypothetical protein AOA65_0910 [Candidatus Bathyarchaeota archaeon BA1]|nr:MAG: hypothetical protein AOA65_0910 [Candidatus Bathyarchaeota archaeon BA1]